MNNILTAVFEDDKYCRVSGAWQYDYGQILRIQGLNLPTAVEIHFSLTEKTGESVTRIGTTKDGVTEVLIPDSMLEKETNQNYSIYAFIFLSDTTSGNTEYRIAIMVNTRPKPEVPGSPEEPEQNINAQVTGFETKVSESVTQAQEEIATTRQQAIGAVASQQVTSTQAVKDQTADYIAERKAEALRTITSHTDQEIVRANAEVADIKNALNRSVEQAQKVESKFDYWVAIAEGKKEIDAINDQAKADSEPSVAERLDALESGLAELAEVMCNG